ncbi:DUF6036 family nucleotidyltransferase [Candidatus Mancarchaeum acidiphilum]|uniref:DUF6036 family nucleotidyltransferase n=1 Tax=Candidatus Mancarchaeum acidiphilum TaxID=1920749 RepID=UPI000B58FB71|nr:DUF6036 family nucleotidyltransferase [Candidatus Mancarchaeum acidiphilum]
MGREILLIAVGGTAMTLLGIKASTKDIDFNIPLEDDFNEFNRVYDRIKPGVKIDSWSSNMIFSEILPEDYVKSTIEYKTNFKKINVRILGPIDIICSKISRLNDSDMEDIKDCIKYAHITKAHLDKRADQYSRAGNDRIFEQNLKYIMENFF